MKLYPTPFMQEILHRLNEDIILARRLNAMSPSHVGRGDLGVGDIPSCAKGTCARCMSDELFNDLVEIAANLDMGAGNGQ